MSLSPEEEVRQLETRLRVAPDDVAAWVRLGAVNFVRAHDPDGALAALAEALRRDPTNVDARFWTAKCHFHDFADPAETQRILEEALALDPARADCLSLLVSALYELGRGEAEYLPLQERAVRSAPDWFAVRIGLARTLLALGRLDDAETQAREAAARWGAALPTDDPLAAYYESAVTGRARPSARAEIEEVLEQIRVRRAGGNPLP